MFAQNHQHNAIRFRRFSRKRYAAFQSVNHEVTIGQVAGYIADLQMKKSFVEIYSSTNKQNIGYDCCDAESNAITKNTLMDELFLNAKQQTAIPASAAGIADKQTYIKATDLDYQFGGFFYTKKNQIISPK